MIYFCTSYFICSSEWWLGFIYRWHGVVITEHYSTHLYLLLLLETPNQKLKLFQTLQHFIYLCNCYFIFLSESILSFLGKSWTFFVALSGGNQLLLNSLSEFIKTFQNLNHITCYCTKYVFIRIMCDVSLSKSRTFPLLYVEVGIILWNLHALPLVSYNEEKNTSSLLKTMSSKSLNCWISQISLYLNIITSKRKL